MLLTNKRITLIAAMVLALGFNAARSHADDAAMTPATTAGKATVTVTVVDADGKPVSGAMVSIAEAPLGGKNAAPATRPDGGEKSKPIAIESGKTAEDGTYALPKMVDGTFVVTARLKGAGNGKARVVIADGKDQTVSITLKQHKAKAAN